MTLSDDIDVARKRLDKYIKHLLSAPEMFVSVSYNGMYKGNKINLRYSNYLKKCRRRVEIARKKLIALERKFYSKKKSDAKKS